MASSFTTSWRKGADAPLAEDHVGIAGIEKVFGAHQQIFQTGGHPTFEQDRSAGLSLRGDRK